MTANNKGDSFVRLMPAVFVLIWSTGFIVARYGMPHGPPMHFLVLRYALSVLCFLPWIWLSGSRWPQGRAQWRHLAVTGILMHAAYLGGVWAAIKAGMGSGVAALVVGLQPVLTAIWLSALGTRVHARQWAGLVLGLVGLVLVVSGKLGVGSAQDHVNLLNLTLVLLALVSITVGTLYQKRFVEPCDVRTANAIQLSAAFIVTLPLALLENESMDWNGESIGAMAWSVLVLTLGGSSLLYLLIQRGAATSVTSLFYLVPPTAALMAWILFGEPITIFTVVGMAITALGVGLVVRTRA